MKLGAPILFRAWPTTASHDCPQAIELEGRCDRPPAGAAHQLLRGNVPNLIADRHEAAVLELIRASRRRWNVLITGDGTKRVGCWLSRALTARLHT